MKNLLPLELLLPLHRDYRRDVKFGILGRWGPIVSCRQPLDSSRSDGVSISGLESPRDHIKSSSDNIVNSMDTARERETKTGTESRSGSYKRPKLQIWQDAACGAVAGLSSRLVVAPLDVIKIRLQVRIFTSQCNIKARSGTHSIADPILSRKVHIHSANCRDNYA